MNADCKENCLRCIRGSQNRLCLERRAHTFAAARARVDQTRREIITIAGDFSRFLTPDEKNLIAERYEALSCSLSSSCSLP